MPAEERVVVMMTRGGLAPRKLKIQPSGRTVNPRGYVLGYLFHRSAQMTKSEANVLVNPDEVAVNMAGEKIIGSDGEPVLNRQFAQYMPTMDLVADSATFELVAPPAPTPDPDPIVPPVLPSRAAAKKDKDDK